MNKKITLRRYQCDDTEFLSKIYYHTIHTINAKDYTEKQQQLPLKAGIADTARVSALKKDTN